jgi:predicted 2-oxoglutarate/Fe(II)-dependent dioxygenase YbiX
MYMHSSIVIPGLASRPYVEGEMLDHGVPLALTIDGVLDAGECARLIDRIEALGPTDAPITTAVGFQMRPEIRNNRRAMFEDDALAAELFARIEGSIPPIVAGMRATGANERFRCYRYDPGQRFAPHFDGAFVRNKHERSELTLMVYLNEGFEGGATAFHDFDVAVVPRTGMALVFQHHLLHEGCVVRSGVKYVLRSDVMYRV